MIHGVLRYRCLHQAAALALIIASAACSGAMPQAGSLGSVGSVGAAAPAEPAAGLLLPPGTLMRTVAVSDLPSLQRPAGPEPLVPPAIDLADRTGALPADRASRRPGTGTASKRSLSLGESVRMAIRDNALIGLSEGRVAEALAGIGVSRSSLYPQLDVSAASGHATLGNFTDDREDEGIGIFSTKNAYGAIRTDVGLSGRQLLYDFGATGNDVSRAGAVKDGETLKLQDQTEEIAQQVANAYLRMLEQRERIAIADDHVGELEGVLRLLGENEAAGNATVADIKRVRARLIDAQSLRADAQSELQSAADRYTRLVRVEPGPLRRPPSLAAALPGTVDAALLQVRSGNPRILAGEAALRSVHLELASQEASTLPRLQLETDIAGRHFITNESRTELDAKVMVALRYKLLDGGLQSSQTEQLHARILQSEMRLRDDREEIEADLRQFYRTLVTARAKTEHLREGTADAQKAKQLYQEQFRGAKRTLLELLDVQAAYFEARTAEVANRFDEDRATYGILRSIGRLTRTALASG